MDQLLLIPANPSELVRLRVAAVTAEQHRKAQAKAAAAEWEIRILLQLDMWGDPTPVTCRVRRRRRPGPTQKAHPLVPDIFAFAALGRRMTLGKGSGERSIRRIVTREDGITRHVGIREQDTAEWAEREQARRARQRPPRPVKGAKTRSKKLKDLIGDGE